MDYNPLLFEKRHRLIYVYFCFVLCDFQLADLWGGGGQEGFGRGGRPLQGLDPLPIQYNIFAREIFWPVFQDLFTLKKGRQKFRKFCSR